MSRSGNSRNEGMTRKDADDRMSQTTEKQRNSHLEIIQTYQQDLLLDRSTYCCSQIFPSTVAAKQLKK